MRNVNWPPRRARETLFLVLVDVTVGWRLWWWGTPFAELGLHLVDEIGYLGVALVLLNVLRVLADIAKCRHDLRILGK